MTLILILKPAQNFQCLHKILKELISNTSKKTYTNQDTLYVPCMIDERKYLFQEIKTFYFNDEKIENVQDVTQMLGDANIICSNFYFATLVNDNSAQPAFMYSFDYLSGWKSNRIMSKSFTSFMTTLAMRRMSVMVCNF